MRFLDEGSRNNKKLIGFIELIGLIKLIGLIEFIGFIGLKHDFASI